MGIYLRLREAEDKIDKNYLTKRLDRVFDILYQRYSSNR